MNKRQEELCFKLMIELNRNHLQGTNNFIDCGEDGILHIRWGNGRWECEEIFIENVSTLLKNYVSEREAGLVEYIYILHATINREDEKDFDPNNLGEVSEVDELMDAISDFLKGRSYVFNATYKTGYDGYTGKE